ERSDYKAKTRFGVRKFRWAVSSAASVTRVAVENRLATFLAQADDFIGVLAVPHFHPRRAHRHARNGSTDKIGLRAQLENVRGRNVAFDELAIDHAGVTGAQAMRHAELGLHCGHVG